ncbi:hypothetical protein BGX26_009337 [Mortierella sp. AD094]|nr:hypothetical protein BGX26_009337 [Mortierella sp. AD094]
MALFHEHTGQLRTWARRALWFIFVTGAFCAIVIPIFSIYRKEGDNAQSVVEVGPQGVSHTGDFIHVVGSVASVDFENKNFRVHFEFTPHGTLAGDDGILSAAISISLFYTTLTFPEDQIMRSVDVTMPYMQGATIDYPFDAYKSYFEILANKEKEQLHKIPVSLTFLGMLQSVEFIPTVQLSNVDLYKISIEISTRRSPTTIGFSLFIVLIMWMLSAAIGIIAIQVIQRHRPSDEHVLTLGITTLFALPALRETQPGIPAIGCAADVLGFYWNMAIIAIASIMILMASALRWKAPSIEAELDMVREEHNNQSKLIKEMGIPMPFPLTGGPFLDYQVKHKKMPFITKGFLGADHLNQHHHQYRQNHHHQYQLYHPYRHYGLSRENSIERSIHEPAYQDICRHHCGDDSDQESSGAQGYNRSSSSESQEHDSTLPPHRLGQDQNSNNPVNSNSSPINSSNYSNSGSSTLGTQHARRHDSNLPSPPLMNRDRRVENLGTRKVPGSTFESALPIERTSPRRAADVRMGKHAALMDIHGRIIPSCNKTTATTP